VEERIEEPIRRELLDSSVAERFELVPGAVNVSAILGIMSLPLNYAIIVR
jgi:hypothetical protein